MVKKISVILSILILSVTFVGCASLEQINTTEKANANEKKQDPREEALLYKSQGYYNYDKPSVVQLTDISNESISEEYKKPFKVNEFETNTSGMTRFFLEDGTIRIVHCNFIVLDK